MSLPFSRSLRALQAERYHPSLVTLLVSMGLLSAWAVWFFLASVTYYTTGQIVGTTRRGTVMATVAPEATEKIRRGQDAILRVQGTRANQVGTLPGIVMNVTRRAEQGRVELYVAPKDANLIAWQEHMTGQVEIAVERLSPATILSQTTGRFLHPSIPSFSPPSR